MTSKSSSLKQGTQKVMTSSAWQLGVTPGLSHATAMALEHKTYYKAQFEVSKSTQARVGQIMLVILGIIGTRKH